MNGLDALQADVAVGTGWDPAELADLTEHRTDSEQDIRSLRDRGINIASGLSKPGRASSVYVAAEATDSIFKINFGNAAGNRVILCRGNRIRGSLSTTSGANLFVCRPAHPNYTQSVDVVMRGPSCAFYFGAGSSSYGLKCSIEGAGTHVVIGDDCLFSEQIKLYATDHHAIIDLLSGTLVNPPESIRIGNHVWFGFGAIVLKGVDIGEGSIVGLNAVVTADVPPWSAVAGSPARLVRAQVSWARTPPSEMAGKRWKMGEDYRFQPE